MWPLCAACSQKPDVVATKTTDKVAEPDSGFFQEPSTTRCRAGHYTGKMTLVRDPYSFVGDIDFSIVETPGAEFPVVKDTSILSGTGANGSKFEAIIPGGSRCVDGVFNTTLDNGTFRASDNSQSYTFHGYIQGQYSAKFNGFSGNWSSILMIVPTDDAAVIEVHGSWSAIWSGDN
jgi:hypothetical protein